MLETTDDDRPRGAIVIAKKEFRDAVRSRALLALTALFALFAAGGVALLSLLPAPADADFGGEFGVVFGLLSPASLFVPIIGLLVGYRAIAGEREDGSIYLLLGLGHDRRSVFVGKLFGRNAVVATAILAGSAVGGGVAAAITDGITPAPFIAFTATTILLGVVFVNIAIGLSATTASTTYAAWGGFGVFVLFQFVWGVLAFGLVFLETGSFPEPPLPAWYPYIAQLNPQNAYRTLATAPFEANELLGTIAGAPGTTSTVALEPWFAGVVLLWWGTVPLLIGYYRFRRADL
ncbi:ABC transporter permease subunit [Halopiger aswanensis]|uniref:ABC-2 type transport system permease protein n=1 Tax=Halopiger aswanensis TaxID=148449 RepID=A0A3R7GVF1_9EURY|nr:ABC transporter permease subunit [Halopiger aswanensis]RKD94897.1 ABC-2 type transport system permease protein [Halopiger aswanensis]